MRYALTIASAALTVVACSTQSIESTRPAPGPRGGGGTAGGEGGDVSSDPLNCGTTGHSCLGGACSAGVCQPFVFARGIDRVTNVAMDVATIYAAFWHPTPSQPRDCSTEAWISRFDRITMTQSALVPCTTSVENNLYSMTLADGAVFWNHTVDPSTPTGAGRLTRTDVVSGVSTQFSDSNGSHTVGVDGQHAYFWDLDTNLLSQANLDGSNIAAIGPSQVNTVLVDDDNVYYFTPVTCNDECEHDGTLVALPKDGSPSSILATGLFGISTAVVHGGFVYWVDGTEDTTDLRRIAVGGGDVQVLANGFGLISLAVDDAYAYFIDSNGGSSRTSGVWRVPIAGGAKEAIFESDSTGLALTVDDTAIVWAVEPVSANDPSAGLMMLAK